MDLLTEDVLGWLRTIGLFLLGGGLAWLLGRWFEGRGK